MTRAEIIKGFIADLARPFSIYAAALSGAWATVVVASKVTTAEGGAIVLGVLAGWGTALYAGKAFETTQIAKQSANVEVSKNVAAAATANAPGGPIPVGGKVELQPGERLQVTAEADPEDQEEPERYRMPA